MIIDALRTATAPLHAALEEAMQSQAIFSHTFQKQDLQKILSCSYLFHNSYEPAIMHTLQHIAYTPVPKLPLLIADLQWLGNKLPAPMLTAPPIATTHAQVLGILYVMEGATLGGQVIKKHLSATAVFEHFPFHYYNCYGNTTGSRWKHFLSVLNALPPHQQDACTTAAVTAFKDFITIAAQL